MSMFSQRQLALGAAGGVIAMQVAQQQGVDGSAAQTIALGAVIGCAALKLGYIQYEVGKDSSSNAMEAAVAAAGGAAAAAAYSGAAPLVSAAVIGGGSFGVASMAVDYLLPAST